jgi:hypothetical protein
MQELLTVELPNGKGWEMPRYLAKKFYDFVKQQQNSNTEPNTLDYESEWLKKLKWEDQTKIRMQSSH